MALTVSFGRQFTFEENSCLALGPWHGYATSLCYNTAWQTPGKWERDTSLKKSYRSILFNSSFACELLNYLYCQIHRPSRLINTISPGSYIEPRLDLTVGEAQDWGNDAHLLRQSLDVILSKEIRVEYRASTRFV
jgi:hypothetical protein